MRARLLAAGLVFALAGPVRADEGLRAALSLGEESATFWSAEASHYTFHSLALSYQRSGSSSGLFVHASGLFPLQARQDGRVVAASGPYGTRFGGDVLLGWQWRRHLPFGAELEAGPALHGSVLLLFGRTGYQDFDAMPCGLGGIGVLRWRPGPTVGEGRVSMGLVASAAADFVDPLHRGDLAVGFTLRASFVFGLDWEPGP